MNCPLCRGSRAAAMPVGRDRRAYFACEICDLYFLEPSQRLPRESERARYDLHEASPDDEGYLRFVAPLVRRLADLVDEGARGLDFGAGRIPVLARWLETRGYIISVYDAFYWPDAGALERTYDFVVSCEVVEHLFEPGVEFARLRGRLAPGAPLVIMTDPRRDEVDFDGWSYRRDPTHVCFYSARTFHWIAAAFGFKNVEIDQRVVTFTTPEES